MGRKERRAREARRTKEARSLEQKNKVKKAITGTVCAGMILSNLATAGSSVYASELEKTSTDTQVEEAQIQEEATTQSTTELENGEGETSTVVSEVEPEASIEESVTTMASTEAESMTEDSTTDETKSTRAIVTSTWGTCPVSFDDTTGILTVSAGTLGVSDFNSSFLDPGTNRIRKGSITKIIFQDNVIAPSESGFLFSSQQLGPQENMVLLEEVVGNVDMSNATRMYAMFVLDVSLTYVEGMEDWDTSNVTDMTSVFLLASGFTHLDLSKWDTSKVTTVQNMFYGTTSLTDLNVNGWDTSSVRNFNRTFHGTGLLSLDLSSWDTSSATDMRNMFENTPLQELTLGEKSKFNSSVNLPAITPTERYTGRWVSVAPIAPQVVYESSSDFMTNYKGDNPGTYVWQIAFDFEVKDSTIPMGSTWNPIDNYVSGQDIDGNPIDFSQVTVNGTVDTSTPGDYEVTYSYGGVTKTATITVPADYTTIEGKDSTIYTGTSWSPADNFVSATDKDGNPVDFAQVTVSGTVDTTTPGNYPITYSYNGKETTITVTVVANQTSIQGKASTIYTGTPWSPADNFVSATDKDGTPVDFSGVTVTGTVNTSVPGDYDVTYSYTDPDTGKKVETTVTITVLEDQTSIQGKASTIYTGTPWSPIDNFVSATDRDGDNVDFAQVTVSGTVNTSVPGDYEVTYSYTDPVTGKKVETTVTVTVTEDQATLAVKDTTIYTSTSWTPADTFVSATDKDGNTIALADVTVTGTVDTNTSGSYEVTYSYGGITKTATITVLEDQTSIEGKASTIYTGTPWSPEDNFVSATDREGDNVDFSDVTVSGTVNTSVPGDYEVTYSYIDPVTGKKVETTVTVTVTQDQETLAVKDSTIYVGSGWTAEDNFISATDKDGNLIDLSGVTVSGTVDTNTPGSYEVTYSYGGMTKTATITVLEDQTSINGKDSTIYTGTTWTPADNFVSAANRDGVAVDFSQVTVTGTVDTSVPGEYDVTYRYTDPVTGKQVETTITVTVTQDEATLAVKDTTIYVGTPWTAADTFVSATDKDGNPVDLVDVTVTGTVDTSTQGKYEVVYTYGGLTQTATITVLANQTSINGKDSTIQVGTTWSPEDNFVSATDKDGHPIDFSDVTVTGTVDPNTPGVYEITYSYGGQSITITVTVVAEEPEKPVTPPTPVEPTTPEKPTTPAVPTNPAKPIGKTQSNSALPKAGEEHLGSTLLSVLGISIAAGAAWFIGIGKRRKHENDTK